MIYADIIIDISSDKLDRSFQYRVPERLEKKIKAGMVAAIPFGNAGRVRKGYVIGLSVDQLNSTSVTMTLGSTVSVAVLAL